MKYLAMKHLAIFPPRILTFFGLFFAYFSFS